MMQPPVCFMTFATSLVHLKGPVRLMSIMLSKSSSVMSKMGFAPVTPALLTRMSIFPQRSITRATMARMASPSDTSTPTGRSCAPGHSF